MQNLCFGCMKPYDGKLKSCPRCGYVPGTRPLEANHLMPGTVLKNGHYVVGRALGSGGFGVTYIAYDFALSQTVAIKEYLPGEFATRMPKQTQLTVGGGEKGSLFSKGKQGFIEESRKLMKFQDVPEIVHVFDCFEGNGTAYIVMEYLDGETLRARLAKAGKLSPEEALPIITDVLHALEKVHGAGMLHRDVAPDNIFLTRDGRTKLLDFGAARFTAMEGTKSLTVMMKPGFTPLEQYAASGGQGPWTDVYAAAATLYAMLTGQVPKDAVERSANDTLKPPRKMGAKISKDMENAILNAMQVKAQFRTQTAEDFERQLESSGIDRVHDKSSRPKNRLPLWVKLVAALGTLCVAVLAGLITYVAINPYNGITGYETERNGQVIVPSFLNLKEGKARELADKRGLKLQFSEQVASGRAIGVVLEQPEGHGNYVDKGSLVNLVLGVSSGMEVIPDVIGLDADAAVAKLKSQGFEVQSVEGESIAAPGTIAEQSFKAGDAVDKGSVVVLTVSTGMEGGDSTKAEKVDDLTGMTYEEAASNAYDKHKLYIVKEYVYDDLAEEGQIVSQDPPVDSSLNQNGTITVKVSMGKAPSVVNYTEEEAKAEFADDDAVSRIVVLGERPSSEYEKGRVISQELQTSPGGETVLGVYLSSGLAEDEKPGRADERDAREETRPQETAIAIEREQPLRQPEPLRGAEGTGFLPSASAAAGAEEGRMAGNPAAAETSQALTEAETESAAPIPETQAPSKAEPGNAASQGSGSTQPSASAKADTAKTYTVSFSTTHGGHAASQTVKLGDYVEEPDLEDVDGYTFVGWYQDASYKREWDFAENVVTKDLKLYAKWEKDDAHSRTSIEAARKESEEAARKESEEAAKKESEEAAKRESSEAVKRESEEAVKRESSEAVKRESEEAVKRESEEAAKKESEEAAKRESSEAAKRESEEAVKRESEEAAKKESEEAAKQESREAAKRESEEAVKRESEEAAKKESEEAAKQESREAAKRESEEAAKRESEEAAKKESEEAAKKESEEAAKREAEEEAARKKAEEEAAEKQKAAEEAARKKAEEEEERRRKTEEETRSKQEEPETEDEDEFDREHGLIDRDRDNKHAEEEEEDEGDVTERKTRETTAAVPPETAAPSNNNIAGNCTITFNANGRGVAPLQMSVKKGTKPVLPSPAAVAGYQFAGWYKEAACIHPWNAAIDTVTANTVLFAKWVPAGSAVAGTAGDGLQTSPETGGAGFTVPETEAYTEAYTEPETPAYTEPETTAYTEPETEYTEPETEAYREPETVHEEPDDDDFEDDFDDEDDFDEDF